jgi:hypothetical protein
MRSTTEVFQSHLTKRLEGDIDGDIKTNYSKDAVFLTGTGSYKGLEGVRQSADELASYLGDKSEFTYNHTSVVGKFAFLEWTATAGNKKVYDGADSFVIENDKIVFQSIHYTVQASARKEGKE